MTQTPIAVTFLDASVLYPSLLRNILMHLALHGLFRAHWSARVHEEWIVALLRNRPDLDRKRVDRTRKLMDEHIPEALVQAYEHRIAALTLPDADDRHVLAAAIQCDTSVIITTNLRDFPPNALAPYTIEAVHPDAFIAGLVKADLEAALAALRQLRSSFKSPPKTAAELLATMQKQDLTSSAGALAAFAERI